MKKFFIFCLMAFVMCSCAATYSYMGNVTLLTDDGNIIEKWDNATLAQGDDYYGTYNTPYKNDGVEITTSQGETIYVNGGIIIMRNIEKVYSQTQNKNEKNEDNELIAQYKTLLKELDELRKQRKLYEKDSKEYLDIKAQISSCKEELTAIENAFWDVSGVHIREYLNPSI